MLFDGEPDNSVTLSEPVTGFSVVTVMVDRDAGEHMVGAAHIVAPVVDGIYKFPAGDINSTSACAQLTVTSATSLYTQGSYKIVRVTGQK